MARKWFDEAVPPAGEGRDANHPLAMAAQQAVDQFSAAMGRLEFRSAAEAILELAAAANGYLNERAPWSVMKQPGQEQLVGSDLYAVLEASRIVAVLLAPLLPELSARMLSQLGLACFESGPAAPTPPAWTPALHWGGLPDLQPLPAPQPVMQRLELDGPL
jgi:methionyl-tRNA synthetase